MGHVLILQNVAAGKSLTRRRVIRAMNSLKMKTRVQRTHPSMTNIPLSNRLNASFFSTLFSRRNTCKWFFPSPFLFVFLSYGLHLMSGPFLNQWSIISQNFRQSLVWVTDQQGETLPSGILYLGAWSHFFPFLLSLTCFNIRLIWHECEPVNSVSLHCKCPMNCGWDKNSHFVDQREMLFSALAFKNSGSQAV